MKVLGYRFNAEGLIHIVSKHSVMRGGYHSLSKPRDEAGGLKGKLKRH